MTVDELLNEADAILVADAEHLLANLTIPD